MKLLKLSHSSMTKYQTCPKMYDIFYNQKYIPLIKGSALYFGNAFDLALNYILKNYKQIDDLQLLLNRSYDIFYDNWVSYKDKDNSVVDLPKNINILYSRYDYDYDLLTNDDLKELPTNIHFQMTNWNNRLKWKSFDIALNDKEKLIYNFTSWLSLKNKAYYMLRSYIENILPSIEEVIDVQKNLETLDPEGNRLVVVIDLIIRSKDNQIVIIDNKSSSYLYESNAIKTSQQLTLYQNVLNELHQQNPKEYPHHIDHCGYFVIMKKLDKIIVKKCLKCGSINDSTHKTCNQIENQKRCNGEFQRNLTFKAPFQILIDKIDSHVQAMVMDNAILIKNAIKNNYFPRNFTACTNKYGLRCDYYYLCWSKNSNNLIIKSEISE